MNFVVVDLLKCGVLTLVCEIRRYRNDCYYYLLLLLLLLFELVCASLQTRERERWREREREMERERERDGERERERERERDFFPLTYMPEVVLSLTVSPYPVKRERQRTPSNY